MALLLIGLLTACSENPRAAVAATLEDQKGALKMALQQEVAAVGPAGVLKNISEGHLGDRAVRLWDGRSVAFDFREIGQSNQFFYDYGRGEVLHLALLEQVQSVSGIVNKQSFVLACYGVGLREEVGVRISDASCPDLNWPASIILK